MSWCEILCLGCGATGGTCNGLWYDLELKTFMVSVLLPYVVMVLEELWTNFGIRRVGGHRDGSRLEAQTAASLTDDIV
jgi:hypothetical protein